MDKRAFLLSRLDLAKIDHFAKTGWGLTQGKAGKRGAFLQASRAEEKRLTDVVAHMEAEAISAYRVRKRPFGAIFVAIRTQSICQDRLGTNTREYTPKRHIFFSQDLERAQQEHSAEMAKHESGAKQTPFWELFILT